MKMLMLEEVDDEIQKLSGALNVTCAVPFCLAGSSSIIYVKLKQVGICI